MLKSSKPMRMWIDGSSFNIKRYKLKELTKILEKSSNTSDTLTISDHDFNIQPLTDGRLSTTFRLPLYYYIRLNNNSNLNLKKLQMKTNTEIFIPKGNKEDNIVVTGKTELDVVIIRQVIHSLVSEIRDSVPAIQFISIPVQSEEVQRNFEQFKSAILNGKPIQGIDETIFQSGLKLHLTISLMSLFDDFEKEEAICALNDCKTEFISPLLAQTGPLKIKVAGIDCMQSNFERVNVLYANTIMECGENQNILQQIANGIADYFYKRGFSRQHQDNVKLHVTLINVKYRKSSQEGTPVNKRVKWQMKRLTFDARSIMEQYKDYYFGESLFDSVHLSYISSKGDDGFYKPLSIINM